MKAGALRRAGYASDGIDDYSRTVPILIPSVVDADLSRFEKNPIILWAFDDTCLPVARAEQITQGPDGLRMVACFGSPGGINPFAEQLWNAVRERVVRAVGAAVDPESNELLAISFLTVNVDDEDAGTPALEADDEGDDGDREQERAAKASAAGAALANHRHGTKLDTTAGEVLEPLGACMCAVGVGSLKDQRCTCQRVGWKNTEHGPKAFTEPCDDPNTQEETRTDMIEKSERELAAECDATQVRLDAKERSRRISKSGEINEDDGDEIEKLRAEVLDLRKQLAAKRAEGQDRMRRPRAARGNLIMKDLESEHPETDDGERKKFDAADAEARFDAKEIAEIDRLVLDAKEHASGEPLYDATTGKRNIRAFDPLVARIRAARTVLDGRDAAEGDVVEIARAKNHDAMHNAWRR